jgi:hypothetical protein
MTKERVSLRAPTCRGVAISVEETVVDIVMQGFGLIGFSSLRERINGSLKILRIFRGS